MVSKIEQYLGEGDNLDIEGKPFPIKPIGVKFFLYQKRFHKFFKAIEGKDENTPAEEFFNAIDEDSMKALEGLVIDTLKVSDPESSDEQRQEFCNKYMFDLIPKIAEVNIPQKAKEAMRKREALNKLVQPATVPK